MPKPATHLLISYPSRKTTLLYRASDGMSIGCQIEINVMFGESRDPAKVINRAFRDETYALAFLRHCGDLDANGFTDPAQLAKGEALQYAASFEERNGESQIVKPNGQLVNTGNSLRN
jgi:hypothetical protein